MQPEYLECFSNTGPIKVSVRFSSASDKHRTLPKTAIHWSELELLIDCETGMFYSELRFDSHICPIKKYEIVPGLNTLTIVVGKIDLP